MSSLSDVYIKLETLEKLVDVLKKKGEKGISITISLNDESNQYDQNVSAYVSQTKEQREAKKERFYVGNGRTFWGVGKVEKPDTPATPDSATSDEDLPF